MCELCQPKALGVHRATRSGRGKRISALSVCTWAAALSPCRAGEAETLNSAPPQSAWLRPRARGSTAFSALKLRPQIRGLGDNSSSPGPFHMRTLFHPSPPSHHLQLASPFNSPPDGRLASTALDVLPPVAASFRHTGVVRCALSNLPQETIHILYFIRPSLPIYMTRKYTNIP